MVPPWLLTLLMTVSLKSARSNTSKLSLWLSEVLPVDMKSSDIEMSLIVLVRSISDIISNLFAC